MSTIRQRQTWNTIGFKGAALAVLATAMVWTPRAQAQTYKILYKFTGGTDGSTPDSTLLLHGGSLYGPTSGGGSSFNCGNVFQLDIQTRQETVLHTFAGSPSDGCKPLAALIRDSTGNFYGTTFTGGANQYGTVFRLDPAGVVTVLHSFSIADGTNPQGGLVRDAAGNLYGTASQAGSGSFGTVFKLDTGGNYTVLHNFVLAPDGFFPAAGLFLEGGILYGTTSEGGTAGVGTIFQVNPTTGAEKVLHSFGGPTDGWYPYAGLIGDGMGNLYGTTSQAGTADGVVYRWNIPTAQETVLYTFPLGGTDGDSPMAPLIRDSQGNLYGTASVGGAGGDGTVFKLDTSGNLTTLHAFYGKPGAIPLSGLTLDAHGNLYGATGGIFNQGYGSVYAIKP
jgi:uncharacterized repeat protein (TIGR03803 family)